MNYLTKNNTKQYERCRHIPAPQGRNNLRCLMMRRLSGDLGIERTSIQKVHLLVDLLVMVNSEMLIVGKMAKLWKLSDFLINELQHGDLM